MLIFLTNILEAVLALAALLIILGFGAIGYVYGGEFGTLLSILGGGLGVVVAAVILGIPITLIRINNNLEILKDLSLLSNGVGSTADLEKISQDTHVRCPDCKSLVPKEARVCRYCRCKLVPQ